MISCSISLATYGKHLRRGLDWAATERADRVEIDARRQVKPADTSATARRQIRHLLSERSLGLSGLCFPLRGSIADPERLDDRLNAVREAMQLAFDLGTRTIVFPFQLPNSEADLLRLEDVLADVCRSGDSIGVVPTLRLGSTSDALNEFLQRATRQSPLAIQFDPAECVLGGDTLDAAVERVSPYVRQVRVIDAVRSTTGFGRETTVGRGEVDFDLLAALCGQLPIEAAVVSPEDVAIAPLSDGLAFAKAVFNPTIG